MGLGKTCQLCVHFAALARGYWEQVGTHFRPDPLAIGRQALLFDITYFILFFSYFDDNIQLIAVISILHNLTHVVYFWWFVQPL